MTLTPKQAEGIIYDVLILCVYPKYKAVLDELPTAIKHENDSRRFYKVADIFFSFIDPETGEDLVYECLKTQKDKILRTNGIYEKDVDLRAIAHEALELATQKEEVYDNAIEAVIANTHDERLQHFFDLLCEYGY